MYRSKYESVVKKFTDVLEANKKIGPFEDELRKHPEKAKELLKDLELYRVWNAYVRRFDIGSFDFEKIRDISDRFEYIALTQEIAHRLSKGEKLNQYELEILEENLKTDVSEDEEKYMGEYHKLIEKQSCERVGGNYFAYETILFAQRVCRLIYLGAPEVIINNESRRFAESFVLHEYATSVKTVSSTIRTLHSIENMYTFSVYHDKNGWWKE